MLLKVNSFTDDYYRGFLEIALENDKKQIILNFVEDSALSRSFEDCYRIEELVQMAYNAGKNQEKLKIIRTQNDPRN